LYQKREEVRYPASRGRAFRCNLLRGKATAAPPPLPPAKVFPLQSLAPRKRGEGGNANGGVRHQIFMIVFHFFNFSIPFAILYDNIFSITIITPKNSMLEHSGIILFSSSIFTIMLIIL
jgi:hypothetical protein